MDSFKQKFELANWNTISQKILTSDCRNIELALSREGSGGLDDFVALLSPLAGKEYLEDGIPHVEMLYQLKNKL